MTTQKVDLIHAGFINYVTAQSENNISLDPGNIFLQLIIPPADPSSYDYNFSTVGTLYNNSFNVGFNTYGATEPFYYTLPIDPTQNTSFIISYHSSSNPAITLFSQLVNVEAATSEYVYVKCTPGGDYCGYHAIPSISYNNYEFPSNSVYVYFNTGSLIWYLQPSYGAVITNGGTVATFYNNRVIVAQFSLLNGGTNGTISTWQVYGTGSSGQYTLQFATCYGSGNTITSSQDVVPGEPLLANIVVNITSSTTIIVN